MFLLRHQRPVVAVSLFSMAGLLISQAKFATQSPMLWWFIPIIFMTLLYYLIALAVASPVGRDFNIARHRQLVAAWRPGRYPSVDVFLPVCGEPIEIIENAWSYTSQLRWPGRLTFYCLDDGADPRLARLCRRFGFNYLSRPDRGLMKKAGNLKYGFERSDGNLILIFDADFCPRPEMLEEMAPYFAADPRLGILQSPQHFRVTRGQPWLERGAGAVQEWFYRVVQVSRNNHEGSICVGTNAVYRRAALTAIGGPTQIGHSEDVHTGFDVRRAGWDLQYLPVIYAIGICPGEMSGFLTQQYRWCMGSMSLLSSAKFWKAPLGHVQRLSYISGFTYYVYTAILTFLLPVIPITLLLFLPEAVLLENYALLAPSALYNFLVLRVWHRHPYGLEAWATKMAYGWAHAFAIFDLIRNRAKGWEPTGRRGGKGALATQFKWGILVWGLGTSAVWIGGAAWHLVTVSWVDFLPILAAGLVYGLLVLKCTSTVVEPQFALPRLRRAPSYSAVAATVHGLRRPRRGVMAFAGKR